MTAKNETAIIEATGARVTVLCQYGEYAEIQEPGYAAYVIHASRLRFERGSK